MSPKRKTNTNHTGSSNKVAKNKETDVVATNVTRSSKRHEKAVVVIEKFQEITVNDTATPTAPLSAIAARRAAMNAGLYKPAEEPEVQEASEDEAIEENYEGIEVQSVTDEEDIRDQFDEDHVKLPISGAATPSGSCTPSMPMLEAKSKSKIPALIDYSSTSRFIPTPTNSCIINQEDDTYLFIGLKPGEHIVFMGQVLAAPLFGSMSIAGAVISSNRVMPKEIPKDDLHVSFYPVFSPRTHSLLSIASASFDMPSITLHKDTVEVDEFLIDAVFDELKDYHDFESIIAIKDLEGSGLEQAGDMISSFNKSLVKMTRKESNRDPSLRVNMLHHFHPILEATPGVKAFKIESSWDSRTALAMENAVHHDRPLISVVCGAKDMGKSSYSRYLINRLLTKYNRVAYLETDVGQSEFTPSGLLSLHYITHPVLGPPYTHQQLVPERSFYFGSASPRSNPDYYLACINQLVDHWRHGQLHDPIPLVVNTQGWISGVGYELLLSQIHKVEPTDVFAMRHPVLEYKNLPHSFSMDVLPVQTEAFKVVREAPTLHTIDCVLQDTNVVTLADSFTSIQQRELTLGSYFHQSEMDGLVPRWDYQKYMIERVPWVIDWRQSLNAVWVTFEEVKLSELFYVLNGSLVGLIGDVIDYQKQQAPKHVIVNDNTFTPPPYFNTQDQPAPSPHLTTCHGLAIVRAIDPSQHALLLLTPLPISTLEKVSGLVKGELQLPLWAMLDHRLGKGSGVANVPWNKVPYLTQESTEGAGANALRVRRNLLRRSQA